MVILNVVYNYLNEILIFLDRWNKLENDEENIISCINKYKKMKKKIIVIVCNIFNEWLIWNFFWFKKIKFWFFKILILNCNYYC